MVEVVIFHTGASSTRTSRETIMADGPTQAQETSPAADRAKEIDALKLDPRQRDLLERTLASFPNLTVHEAHQMLSEAGM